MANAYPYGARPLETPYKGYRFRSRNEARWAVFMDALPVAWEYEPEGFDLDGLWYLPDFWLPDHQCWVEIKPRPQGKTGWGFRFLEWLPPEEFTKAQRLAIHTQRPVYLFAGPPAPLELNTDTGESSIHAQYFLPDGETEGLPEWGECPACRTFGIGFLRDPHHRSSRFSCACGIVGERRSPRLLVAYAAAKKARFEHGEHP